MSEILAQKEQWLSVDETSLASWSLHSEGDGADTFLRYVEGFVISGLHCISNYGNIHCYMKKFFYIFITTNNSSLFNIYKFKFIKRGKLLCFS